MVAGCSVVLGIEDRQDAAGLGLRPAQLGELLQRGRARLVEHHVLAGAHGPHRHRRAVGQDAGADDERDLGILEDLRLVGDAPGAGIGLGIGGGEVVLRREERFQPAAGVEHHVRLAVDVAVIDADGGKGEAGSFGHSCSAPR